MKRNCNKGVSYIPFFMYFTFFLLRLDIHVTWMQTDRKKNLNFSAFIVKPTLYFALTNVGIKHFDGRLKFSRAKKTSIHDKKCDFTTFLKGQWFPLLNIPFFK